MRTHPLLLSSLVALAACDPDPGTDADTLTTPDVMAFTVNAAFDYSSGSYSIVDLETLVVIPDVLPVHPDSTAACTGGRPYVIERRGADTVTAVEREVPFGIAWQHGVGSGANPQGILALGTGDILVSLLEADHLLVMDPVTGGEAARVDLSWASDADGTPETCGLAFAGDVIAVALQRLDRESAMWDPVGPGWIVTVDPDTLEAIDADPSTPEMDAIELNVSNPSPYSRMQYDGDVLLVAGSGFYGALDGGVDAVDLQAGTVTTLIGEAELGGDLTDFVVVSDTVGYATVSTDAPADMLVRFDPSTGVVDPDPVVQGEGFTLLQMQLTGDGRLLVVDRDLDEPGLIVLDAGSGEVQGKVSVGMAPFSVCIP